METANEDKYTIYSSSYVVKYGGGPGSAAGAARSGLPPGRLRKTAGWLWRALCFKVVLITILSLFCGFFVGAVWGIYETDSLAEYETYEEKIEWLLHEAKI